MNHLNGVIPDDFDWKLYLEINEDVKVCYSTKEEAIKHYLNDGIKQKRIYKTSKLPSDFDWELYLALNPDVYCSCKSKTSSIMHYENHGYIEKRPFRLKHLNISEDFDWEQYILINSSLNISSKIDAISHYITNGRKKKLSYKIDDNEIPKDFNWILYQKLNSLEGSCFDKKSAINHYWKVGKKNKLLYNFPKGSIPNDFNWITYIELNTDVKSVFGTKELATYHYYFSGKNENRIYKFCHTPSDFNCETYVQLNETMPVQYKKNEYTIKLHYDLFGYRQQLPYKDNFTNIPEDFNWKLYIKLNKDIQDICKSEIQAKNHYNNFGIYQNRCYKKGDLQTVVSSEYSKYPFLFHKYILNISTEKDRIPYSIYTKNKTIKKDVFLIAHLHCYNIEQFNSFYEKQYMNVIRKQCEYIIITYSVGNLINKVDDYIYLKCLNQGMDIGGKFVCIDYIKRQNITYNSILFLHSKTDTYIRKLYWEPLINNMDSIIDDIKNKRDYGIFVPPLVYMGDYATIIYKDQFANPDNVTCKWNFGNSLYLNDIDRYFNFNKKNFLFPEGNSFICNHTISNQLYGDSKLYFLLNSKLTMDIVWIKSLYGTRGFQVGNTVDEINQFFLNENQHKIYPNNIAWGAGHNGHADNMYEHSFERIVFKVVQKYNFKVKVMPYKSDEKYITNLHNINERINEILTTM